MKISFKTELDIETTMAFERYYPESLQMDLESKELLCHIASWLFLDNTLVGECYGIPLAEFEDEDIPGLKDHMSETQSVYCYSNTIISACRREGYGTILKAHWLGQVAAFGYTKVYGHARPGGSHRLNDRFGVTWLDEFPNWYDTGETYQMYSMEIE